MDGRCTYFETTGSSTCCCLPVVSNQTVRSDLWPLTSQLQLTGYFLWLCPSTLMILWKSQQVRSGLWRTQPSLSVHHNCHFNTCFLPNLALNLWFWLCDGRLAICVKKQFILLNKCSLLCTKLDKIDPVLFLNASIVSLSAVINQQTTSLKNRCTICKRTPAPPPSRKLISALSFKLGDSEKTSFLHPEGPLMKQTVRCNKSRHIDPEPGFVCSAEGAVGGSAYAEACERSPLKPVRHIIAHI